MSETPDDVVIPAGALASSSVRVDTWLWATRQLKSRSQATAAVRAGHVRVNGEPVKAAYKVRVGDARRSVRACIFPSPCGRGAVGAQPRRSVASSIGCAATIPTSTTKLIDEAGAGPVGCVRGCHRG